MMRSLSFTIGAGLMIGCGGGEPAHDYVQLLGSDTLAAETFSRTANAISGTSLSRVPATRVVAYTATLDNEGRIRSLDATYSTPEQNTDGRPPLRVETSLDGDTVTVVRDRDGQVDTTKVGVPPGTILTTGEWPPSVAFLEHLVNMMNETGSDSLGFEAFQPQGPQTAGPSFLTRTDDETFVMSFFGFPLAVHVADGGHVVAVSGAETTFKIETAPAVALDFQTAAAGFAALDARGEGVGVPSPPAEAHLEAGDKRLRVAYSQPAVRGRTVWGGVVPYGEIWRTGAGAATSFTTNVDLTVGGVPMPAGQYTMYSVFTETTDTLIINRQTGQFGTVYDQDLDLVRVGLERRMLDEPSERFTIQVDDAPDGVVFRMRWGPREFSVTLLSGG